MYGTKTVIEAVASGRAAASEIDRFLGGDGDISEVLAPEEQKLSNIGRIEGFGYLRRAKEDIVQADKRKNNFNDVNKGLCNDDICSEAGRCLQCDLRFDITKHRVWSDYSISNEVEVNKNAN